MISLRARRLDTALRWVSERQRNPTSLGAVAMTGPRNNRPRLLMQLRRRARALAARRMPPKTLKLWSYRPTHALLAGLSRAWRAKIVSVTWKK